MIRKFAALNFAVLSLATTRDLSFQNNDCLLKFANFSTEKSDDEISIIQGIIPLQYRSACIYSPEASSIGDYLPTTRRVTATMAKGRLNIVCPDSQAEFSFNYSMTDSPFVNTYARSFFTAAEWSADVYRPASSTLPVTNIYHYNLLIICDGVAARRELWKNMLKPKYDSVDWGTRSADEDPHRSSTAILPTSQSVPKPLGLLTQKFEAPVKRGTAILANTIADNSENVDPLGGSQVHLAMIDAQKGALPHTQVTPAQVSASASTAEETVPDTSVDGQLKPLYWSASRLVALHSCGSSCLEILRIRPENKPWPIKAFVRISGRAITDLLNALPSDEFKNAPDSYRMTWKQNLDFKKSWNDFYKFYKTMFQVSPLVYDTDETQIVFVKKYLKCTWRVWGKKIGCVEYSDPLRDTSYELSDISNNGDLEKNPLEIPKYQIVAAAKTFVAIVGKQNVAATHKLVKVAKTASRRAQDFLKKGAVSWSYDIVPKTVDAGEWKTEMVKRLDVPQVSTAITDAREFWANKFSAGSMTYLECTQEGVTLYRFRKLVPDSDINSPDVNYRILWECDNMFTTYESITIGRKGV